MTRTLAWAGCANVRDLGGVPVAGGGETRYGALVRADNIRTLTGEGWAELSAYGVQRVVDLRWPEEVADDAPGDAGVDAVHVSLLGEWDPSVDDGADAFAPARDAAGYREHLYSRWLGAYRTQFASALAAIADADGPVVFHCAGGKDRTGLVAALLLRLAGASIAAVAADYALSEAAFLQGGEDDETYLRLSTPADGMARTLASLERTYGSVEEYLLGGGLDDDRLARLKERLAPA